MTVAQMLIIAVVFAIPASLSLMALTGLMRHQEMPVKVRRNLR
jgi:hypothetical protein